MPVALRRRQRHLLISLLRQRRPRDRGRSCKGSGKGSGEGSGKRTHGLQRPGAWLHYLLWRHLSVPSLLLRRHLPVARLMKLLKLLALLNLLNGSCSCSKLSLLLKLQLLDLMKRNCSYNKPPLSCNKLPLLPARRVIRLLLVRCRACGPHAMVLLQLARLRRRRQHVSSTARTG